MAEFELTLSHQPWGTVLDGRVEFAEEMRFLLFAWNSDELAWAKAPGFATAADLSLCYYPSPIGRLQLITRVGMGGSSDLMLTPRQGPTTGAWCTVRPSQVSILYRTELHGVGLVVLPRKSTQSRRKQLWHIRSEAVSEELQLFVQAYGRSGTFTGHPYAPARHP
jgi:hypothetical protein